MAAQLLSNLSSSGVDITCVEKIPGISSGVEMTIVDEKGENSITFAHETTQNLLWGCGRLKCSF